MFCNETVLVPLYFLWLETNTAAIKFSITFQDFYKDYLQTLRSYFLKGFHARRLLKHQVDRLTAQRGVTMSKCYLVSD